MATGTGIDAQFGFGEETTHGTPVTVDRFAEFLTENITNQIARLDSQAIGSGRRGMRRWAPGAKTVGGDVTMELVDKGLGLLLHHAVGDVVTSGAGPDYTHTFTPGDPPPGLTVQMGRPSTDGTVRPFTYPGGRITDWQLGCSVGEIAQLGFTFNCKDELTDTPLASAVLPTDVGLMTFVGGTLTVGGTEIPVTQAQFQVSNGLTTDRWKLGSDTRRDPKATALRDAQGSFAAEFVDLSVYDLYRNAEENELVLTFQGPEVAAGTPSELKVRANVRYDGATPTNSSGPDELPLNVSFRCVDNGTLFYEVVYVTSDATP